MKRESVRCGRKEKVQCYEEEKVGRRKGGGGGGSSVRYRSDQRLKNVDRR